MSVTGPAVWFYCRVDGSETDIEQTIVDTFTSVAKWREMMSMPSKPRPNTDLSIDDEDWPYFPPSTVAWTGIASATDHLDAIRRHVETHSTFPFAHLTLCRSALVGAAQTVWVLAPEDRSKRLRRYRTVLAYAYKKHEQYLDELLKLNGSAHLGTTLVADRIKERKQEFRGKRERDGQRNDLDTTAMIREAAKDAFPGQPELIAEAVLVWRHSSGAAHGLAWPLLGGPGTIQTKLAGDDDIGEFQAGGSLARIGNVYMAAFHFADRGWKLIRRRGTGPPPESEGS